MTTTRRHFLGAAAGVGLGAPLLAQQAQQAAKKISANDHIQIALIGCGGMGQGDASTSTSTGLTKVIAACDCYDGRLEHMKEQYGRDIFTTKDYKEILSRKDIDAVIIGTPDHWHQPITVAAMKAGKDVYCEKPMVHAIDEGHAVIDAQHQTNRILQIGSQRVSSVVYAKARDLFRQGAIGALNMVEAWWDRNSAIGAWQYSIPPDATPENIDWDRFLGRASKVPFEPVRLFRWRNYRDYGTGVAGDLFVHLFSRLHFVTGSIGPTRVYAAGGLRFWKDGRDVPDVLLGLYDYPQTAKHPAFNLALRVNFVDGGSENSGFKFIGSEGIMTIGNGVTVAKTPRESEPGYTIDTFPKATQEEFLKEYREQYPRGNPTADAIRPQVEDRYNPPQGYSDHRDHHRNFLAAVRSRKPVIEDAVFGFRAAGPALLSNVSYFEQRICTWNPETMIAS